MFKRILFIGLGGAGQRHLRLFKQHTPKETELIAYRSTSKTPVLNSDFTVNRGNSLEELYGVEIFSNLDDAINTYPDLAVISTPSSLHMEYAQLCAENGINIFVEKPLSHSLKDFKRLKETVLSNKLFLQVGFQRRYHPHFNEIQRIITKGKIGDILSVTMTVSSYIPFWHPYEDFRELYACKKDLGGGVLLTEIHEFDLCVWYFGKPFSVTCVGGTFSNVGLDVEDTVRVILNYKSFLVQVNLTFWQKHAERSVFISGEEGCVLWNQDENSLRIKHYKNDNEVTKHIEMNNDSMFKSQVKDILTPASDKSSVNLNDSYLSIAIVIAAKKSMVEKRTINLDEIN
jgi:predicted dehydrogenase